MQAVLEKQVGPWRMSLRLSSADQLHSHLPADDEFDSSVEAAFCEKWGDEPRDGWRLLREAEILHVGQKTFVPDFVLQHDSGRRVLMEIVGFWTPEYIQHRVETLQVFRETPIILAIAESTADHFTGVGSHAVIVHYKTALLVKHVLEALETVTLQQSTQGNAG